MSALAQRGDLADRTDAEGNFLFEFELSTEDGVVVHFASPDFSRQAIHSVRFDDVDEPAEITLRPVRQVRARLFEKPWDVVAELEWYVYAVDPAQGKLHEIRSIGGNGACWVRGPEYVRESGSADPSRRLEVRLPAGRYKVVISSDTVDQTVDLVVPPGDGPLDLPQIRLESTGLGQNVGPAGRQDRGDGS